MKKSLKDISPTTTSHKAGMKRVLLAAEESGCAITQIAITELKAGEAAEGHVHDDMQEGFYVLTGLLEVKLDYEVIRCEEDDFIWVESGCSYELRAITDVRMMTIGCAK